MLVAQSAVGNYCSIHFLKYGMEPIALTRDEAKPPGCGLRHAIRHPHNKGEARYK